MYSGGQGVYVSNLSRELAALGHDVHVISGPPYPDLVESVQLHKLKNYNYHRLLATGRRFFYGRPPLDAFNVLNLGELVTTRIGMYSVMGAFSIRAYEYLKELSEEEPFDVVHDNQVLGYGTLLIKAMGARVVAVDIAADKLAELVAEKTVQRDRAWRDPRVRRLPGARSRSPVR